MKHLTFVELLNASSSQATTTHLAHCKTCAARVEVLQTLKGNISAATETAEKSSNCPDAVELASAVDGNRAELLPHINSCDYCLAAAGYYVKESDLMKKAEMADEGMEETNKRFMPYAIKTETKIKNKKQGKTRRWLYLPMAVSIAALLFITLSGTPETFTATGISGGKGYAIYSQKSSSTPLFFFGNDGKKTGMAEGSMSVQISKNGILLSWSNAPKGSGRYLLLQDITGNMARLVIKKQTDKSNLMVQNSMLKAGNRYRWIVAGATDGGYFKGVAEFTFSHTTAK